MEYESSLETAARLNVSSRAVQKWAKEGKIPGAKQVGRIWMIPKGAVVEKNGKENAKENRYNRRIMPLSESDFKAGHCIEYIENMQDELERNIAWGEYYYFTGQPEKAVQTVEGYLDSEDMATALSASLIYTFASLAVGGEGKKTYLAQRGREYTAFYVKKILTGDYSDEMKAAAVFIANCGSVLLHIPSSERTEIPPVDDIIRYLPRGLKLYGAYVMAHDAYLKHNYERSFGIAETALAFCSEEFVIGRIYIKTIMAMDLANMKKTEEAKEIFMAAWELAEKDGLIECFAEHHGLLHGLVEVCLKKKDAVAYKQVVSTAVAFSRGWIKLHKAETSRVIADNLTTIEFSIAMLYNRGWSIKEIAAHMDMAERTIKHHISIIYEKLGISSRVELEQYMLI